MLAWTIYISFIGALAARLAPSKQLARILALLTAIVGFALTLVTLIHFQPGKILEVANIPWIPTLGISYHLAADGISLTVNKVTDRSFFVSIIPHTAKITTLGLKQPGASVNLETDIVGKYVSKYMQATAASR